MISKSVTSITYWDNKVTRCIIHQSPTQVNNISHPEQ